MTVAVGTDAPDFTLPGIDEHGEKSTYTLSELRGRPVVLVFYPGDDTPVCTRQLNAYTTDIDSFVSVDAQVLALSPQSVDSHVRFAGGQGGFGFPLLADVDKAVGGAYGVLGPLGFYRRSVVVVDTGGKVAWAHRSVAGVTFKPTAQLVEAVRAAS
jgi:peroxiredoxin Q/BCP